MKPAAGVFFRRRVGHFAGFVWFLGMAADIARFASARQMVWFSQEIRAGPLPAPNATEAIHERENHRRQHL